jgi:hypothetical protein
MRICSFPATTTGAVCTSSPTTSFQYSTTTPPQCLNYTLNIDGTRNLGYTSTINLCDNVSPFNSITPVWIRFQDPAGTVVVNSPVPPNYCGTVATGWYAGQYPSVIYSTATSIACFYQTTNTCSSCNSMSVTNCNSYFVFLLLEPQSCNYRYCTIWFGDNHKTQHFTPVQSIDTFFQWPKMWQNLFLFFIVSSI